MDDKNQGPWAAVLDKERLDTPFYARGQNHEVARSLERIHDGQERWRGRDELALIQIQPASRARNSRAQVSIGSEDLVPEEEAAAVRCVARECISHRDLLLEADLFEVLDLVLHDHGADSEPQELFNRKAIFD